MNSYTLLEFLDSKFLEQSKAQSVSTIEVPMLQRDYAQGRQSQERVAKAFLDAIFAVLKRDRGALHLDLIYGYQDNQVFKLIDGQQRITTLWLLYYLLYKRCGQLDKIKDKLEKFTYNTRESSAEFCQNLLQEEGEFELNGKPSSVIDSKSGIFGSDEDIKNDPTIKAMIHMLDLIYEKLQNHQLQDVDLLERLERVTFSVINMEDFKLGEDLYVKMNARGKPLSKFENLKAFIEQANISNIELLSAIDNTWSDYFFDPDPEQLKVFDDRFFHFLHYANAFFALEHKQDNKDQQGQENITVVDILNTERAIDKSYRFLQERENLELLDRTIKLLPKWQDEGKKLWFFGVEGSKFFDQTLGNKEVCYFFALLFMVKTGAGKLDLDYLRVCGHFIENFYLYTGDIEGCFRLLKEISEGVTGDNFYRFLSEHKRTSQFNEKVYEVEHRKAKLISNNSDWREVLEKVSDHRYLRGYVNFLLDFSGGKDKEDLEKFRKYAELTIEILDTFFLKTGDLALFQRAFLCFGNYSKPTSGRETNYFFGNRHETGSFRYRQPVFNLFEKSDKRSKDGKYYEIEILYFKKLLDYLLKSQKQTLEEKLRDIIQNYRDGKLEGGEGLEPLEKRSWWEQLLIQQEELFTFINQNQSKDCGKIQINDQQVYLIKEQIFSSESRDLLGYALYCYCKEKEIKEEKEIKKLSLEYENNRGARQFTIKNSAIFADSKESEIKIAKIKLEEQEREVEESIKINLKDGDILKKFERVLPKILEIVEKQKNDQKKDLNL
ncbi:GmrSD restriction endonuclease domain-containing protein [Helicobacter suis]|uniref:GmrSD restriction endonuclease domain-containing protein n=1 Tax=Helicobacter suis TaxID=104628 RepID=UPI0013D4AEF7|nr:DUF262 domain-containing protein [Helicobacter suis]